MFAIDDPTAATVMPTPEAAGTAGFWTEGNPTLGVEATRVRASFLNGIQAELLAILTAAGITPSKTTYDQLLQAMNLLYKAGRVLNVRAVTSSGTYTQTAGTLNVWGRQVGGGGAGGGSAATAAGQLSVGSGGNSGAYMEFFVPVATLAGQTMTIGAGGTASAGAAGGSGSATTFGPYTAPGGQGGQVAAGTSAIGVAAPVLNTPIASGTPSLFRGSVGNGGTGFVFNGVNALSGSGGDTVFGNGPTGRQGAGGGGDAANFGCGGAGAL
ncbi:MAG: hypothetical protein WA159_17355, partial [Variovorax sp.]